MKVIGMLGYTEKIDFIMNLVKTLDYMGKTVLVIDATNDKKYKYIIPSITETEKQYITQFDKVDYAVGFESMPDIENFMTSEKINISLYDYIILDIDNAKTYEFFRTRPFDKTYLFEDTSILSLKKNKEIINTIKIYNTDNTTLNMTRVLYRGYLLRSSENYFERALSEVGAVFNEKQFEIVEEEQDRMITLDNQLSSIIQVKKHTNMFIDTLSSIAADILEDEIKKDIIKAIKRGKF